MKKKRLNPFYGYIGITNVSFVNNRQLKDDMLVFGEAMTKTTEIGIERIEPLSDEWDSVKSKMV